MIMDLSLLVSYLDLFSGSILFTLSITKSPTPMYFLHRLGLATLGLGLLAQSFVVFTELNQLEGWGQLWALKDIGCFILAVSAITGYLRLMVYNRENKKIKCARD